MALWLVVKSLESSAWFLFSSRFWDWPNSKHISNSICLLCSRFELLLGGGLLCHSIRPAFQRELCIRCWIERILSRLWCFGNLRRNPPTSSKFRICNRARAFKLIVASSAFDSIRFLIRFIVVLYWGCRQFLRENSHCSFSRRGSRNFPQFDHRSLQVRCFIIVSIKFAARTSFCEGEKHLAWLVWNKLQTATKISPRLTN